MRFLRFLWGWWGAPTKTTVTPEERILYVASESRSGAVAFENRAAAISLENRTWVIPE